VRKPKSAKADAPSRQLQRCIWAFQLDNSSPEAPELRQHISSFGCFSSAAAPALRKKWARKGPVANCTLARLFLTEKPSVIARLVGFSADRPLTVTAAGLVVTVLALIYAMSHFAMTTDTDKLLSTKLPFRVR
jgi:hypothetical protein